MLTGALTAFFGAVAYGLAAEWRDLTTAVRWVLLFWLVALPAGLHFLAQWVRADFIRTAGRVEVARRGIFGRRLEVYPLAHFQRARVDENRHEGVTRRLVFEFANEALETLDPDTRAVADRRRKLGTVSSGTLDVPFTAYYSGVTNAEAAAAAINEWAGISR